MSRIFAVSVCVQISKLILYMLNVYYHCHCILHSVTVRGEGSAPSALNASKCENFDFVFFYIEI